jgi:hypothetical protein
VPYTSATLSMQMAEVAVQPEAWTGRSCRAARGMDKRNPLDDNELCRVCLLCRGPATTPLVNANTPHADFVRVPFWVIGNEAGFFPKIQVGPFCVMTGVCIIIFKS